MYKKILSLFSILLLGSVLPVFSQVSDPHNYVRTDLIPASPNAASLSKYGNVPVTMYTGMANVTIPIFTVQGSDISLPISLSYSYNGLKPAEQISWVGLGWSLQAGGVITRNIRGKPDESVSSSNYAYENSRDKYTNANINSDQQYLKNISKYFDYDPEIDIYSFNFGSYSGKFVMFKNRAYLMPANKKLKISGNANGYQIITEDGTIYTFNAIEYTRAKNSTSVGDPTTTVLGGSSYASAWHLTSVQNAAKTETITLQYTDEGEVAQTGAWSQTFLKSTDPNVPAQLFDPKATMPTMVHSLRLTGIYSSRYTVSFNAEPGPRLDINQAVTPKTVYALGSISIAANNGGYIKSFRLGHGYFNASSSSYNYRYLKLNSVSEIGKAPDETHAADSLQHLFTYEDGSFPERYGADLGVDQYSYYNGGGSGTLIPSTIYSGGANKVPNAASAALGSLKKIIYPTGGATEFTYEGNSMPAPGYVTQTFGVAKSITRPNTYDDTELTDTVSFYSNTPQWIKVYWSRIAKAPSAGDDAKDNFHAEVNLYNTDDDLLTVVKNFKITANAQNSGIMDSVQIGTGRYLLMVVCDKSENGVAANTNVKHLTNIPNTTGGPGIRVKKIVETPVIGPQVVRNYKYENGIVSQEPNYSSDTYYERVMPSGGGSGSPTYTYYTSFNATLSQGESPGVPYYYGKVTEDTGSDTLTVKRSVYFFADAGGYNLGIEPVSESHYKRIGTAFSLTSRKAYGYSPVYSDTTFIGVRPHMEHQEYVAGSSAAARDDFYEGIHNAISSDRRYLLETKETVYNNDTLSTTTYNVYNPVTRNLAIVRQASSDGRASTQKMKYPEDYTNAITGNMVTANVVSPVIERQVWQRLSSTDSVLIGGTITQYDPLIYKPTQIYAFESVAGISSLNSETKDGSGKYNTLLSDNRYKQRVTYSYDANAKINGQQLTGGSNIGYKYGYLTAGYTPDAGKSNYPIVEAKNATASEFYAENFEDNSSAAMGAAHTGSKHYNGSPLTVNWTRPNSRAYVVSYWYKSGSNWLYSGETAYTGSSFTLNTGSAYDDIRIYPADAQLTTFTHNPGVGASSTIDAKGITTYVDYDLMSRVAAIRDQSGNIKKYFNYNYARFENTIQSQVFTRSNCTAGTVGGSYTYTVLPGTFTSIISQEDANNKALADIAAKGQAAANANAGCVQMLTLSYYNYTVPFGGGYPYPTGGITQLKIKNASGTTLFTFNETQLAANPQIPQGNYVFEFTTWGDCFDWTYSLGWNSLSLSYTGSTNYINSACVTNGVYTMYNVNLSSVTTCGIYMDQAM